MLAGTLFMNVKKAFDHDSKAQPLRHIINLGIDKDLIR